MAIVDYDPPLQTRTQQPEDVRVSEPLHNIEMCAPLFSKDGTKRAWAIVGMAPWAVACWGYNVLVQM